VTGCVRKVRVFFYGSFMNRDVLAESNVVPDDVEVGRVGGFDIQIQPLANLVRSEAHCVFGIVCLVGHAGLVRLYAQSWVGTYLPEAVVVETRGGGFLPALCYSAPSPPAAPATNEYIERIAGPAREYGFPEWYVSRLESFRPPEALREQLGDER
jgi:hypothetical protein